MRAPGESLRAQRIEKALADWRCRRSRRVAGRATRARRSRARGSARLRQRLRLVRHRERRAPVARGDRGAAAREHEAHDRVDRREARRRLAQRSGRQQQAVAEAARRVDDRDLDVARERVVLQSVVGDDHVDVRVRREQRRAPRRRGRRRPRPARRSPRGSAARRRRRARRRRDRPRARRVAAAAVAAADDPGTPAALAQRFDERDDERRLARAAGGDVADDDHRNAATGTRCSSAAPIRHAAQRGHSAEHATTAAAARCASGVAFGAYQRARQQRPRVAFTCVARSGDACVANVMCTKPAARAASITCTTD